MEININEINAIYQDRVKQEIDKRDALINEHFPIIIEKIKELFDTLLDDYENKQTRFSNYKKQFCDFSIKNTNENFYLPPNIYTIEIYPHLSNLVNKRTEDLLKVFLQKHCDFLGLRSKALKNIVRVSMGLHKPLSIMLLTSIPESNLDFLKDLDLDDHPYFISCIQKAHEINGPLSKESLAEIVEEINKFFDAEVMPALESLPRGGWDVDLDHPASPYKGIKKEIGNIPTIEEELDVDTDVYVALLLKEIHKRLDLLGQSYKEIAVKHSGFNGGYETEEGEFIDERRIVLHLAL